MIIMGFIRRGKLSRKGDLTSFQIISIVLAIAGFVVVLIFLSILFSDRGETDREVCRLSILTRATAPDVIQANVPLKCKTEKICITTKLLGGECSQFLGEENVRKVRVKNNPREIEKLMAEQMYFCWSMMGQGELDLFGKASAQFLGSSGDSTCNICSRVAFADDVDNSTLEQINLDSYMRDNQVPLPGSQLTYLEAFTNKGTKTFGSAREIGNSLDVINSEAREKLSEGEIVNLSGRGERQVAFVFAQVKTVAWTDVLTNLGAAAVGSSFVIPGAAKLGRALFLTKAGLVTIPVVVAGAGAIGYNAYQGELAAAGYCGNYVSSTEDGLRGGCSLIQAVNYNVQDVNALCTGSIQSIP
jgi:hypothetical protein